MYEEYSKVINNNLVFITDQESDIKFSIFFIMMIILKEQNYINLDRIVKPSIAWDKV